jgi:hypothetical protein
MEGGRGSGRASSKEGLKADKDLRDGALYNTIKLLLYDERGFRQLCDIDDNGVYRDVLEMRLRQWIRPLSRKDAQDYITNLVALGVFDTVIETMERAVPVEQLRGKGTSKRKKGASKAAIEAALESLEPEFRALVPEDLRIPSNSQLVGFTRIGLTVYAILRFWKVKLVPSRLLREVCCQKFYVCEPT